MDVAIRDGRIWFGQDGNGVPRIKTYLNDSERGLTPESIWFAADAATNEKAKSDLKELFDGEAVFDTPKPVELVQLAARLCATEGIVLDFFAGSGVTAHAALALNQETASKLTFILVQLPEPTDRTDYPTIADITKERVRRVIKKLNESEAAQLPLGGNKKQDRGFRVYKLAESNLKTWNANVPHDAEVVAKQLDLHVEHLREGRSTEDLLWEILLKSGFPLTTPIETLTLAGKPVHSAAGGAMLLCLDRELTLEVIRAIAERKPSRVVLLDEGFAGNDQLKTNAVQIFKTKGVVSFRTV
jgi:adenine-specific DNA-methyltransferase